MSGQLIYLDNAATSFPRAPGVVGAVADALEHGAGGPGRSFGAAGEASARVLFNARERLAQLLGWPDSADVILTPGATFALNLALYGLLQPGDPVGARLKQTVEHNAVARPLSHLQSLGVEVTRVPCPDGLSPDVDAFRGALRPNSRLIAAVHGSNVTGAILPLRELAELAREAEVLLLVDAAQTAGTLPIDLSVHRPDLLAFAGHKGLLGPPGTGGMYISPEVSPTPLVRGGTGSRSHSDEQPSERPECLESGTPNVPGFAGLAAAAEYLLERGVEEVRAHEVRLIGHLLEELRAVGGVTTYGPSRPEQRTGLLAFNLGGLDPAEVGMRLEREYGIISRCGFHCAAWAHESIGTTGRGAVRLSVSPFTTANEIEAAVRAVREIATTAH